MAELVKKTRDKVIVRPRGDWNHRGKVLQALGVLLALGAVPLGMWVDEKFFLLGIAAAVLVVVGLPMVLVGKRTVLDVTARNILLANGDVVAFDQIVNVDLRTYVHEVSRQQGTVQHLRFRVALVQTGHDPDHAEHVEHARKQIEEAVAKPGGRLDTAQFKALSDEISGIGKVMPAGEPVVFADHADELKMWRVAERVAKTLDVPIADYCGDEVVIRTPAELDVPLGERIARMGAHNIAELGETPQVLRDESTDDHILISWAWPVWGAVIAMTLLGVVFALVGFVIWDDMPEIRIGFGATGGAFLAFAAYIFDGRRKAIEVTREFARFRGGAWLRRSRRIPVSGLEMIRVNKTLGSSLSLISDDRIVRCPMPGDAADWTSTRIERFLVAAAHSPEPS